MSDPLETIQLQQISTELKDGTHGTHQRVNVGIPFLSAKNIGKNGQINWSQEDDRISLREFELIHSNFSLVPGDLLLTIVGSLGRAAVYRGERVTFQRSVAYIRPNPTLVSSAFLHQAFRHPSFQRQLISRSNATAQAGLYLGELAKTEVPLFRLAEQQKIAQILDTLDTQIQKTEALIAKLEKIKEGLLHDLLTRGVDQNGQLRPSSDQAPELYRESVLGLIPKEWKVLSAETVCEAVIDCKNRTPPERMTGFPVIRTPNVRNGRFVYSDLLYTDRKSYKIWTQRGAPRPGDIVITREAPVGEVCKIPSTMNQACLGQRMMMYQPDPNIIDTDYMLATLVSRRVQTRLLDLAGGSTVGHVKVGDIRQLAIPTPPIDEQTLIAESFKSIESRLSNEARELEKLRLKKHGLMDDLLTGRVRVTPLLKDAV